MRDKPKPTDQSTLAGRKPPAKRDEGVKLIIAIRVLQVLIILMLWFVTSYFGTSCLGPFGRPLATQRAPFWADRDPRRIDSASNLQAAAGWGASAASFVGNNGGGGGVAILVYETLTINDASTMSSATNCAGGVGGAASGTGTAGSNGTAGTLVLIPMP